jgi:hypothetical protein
MANLVRSLPQWPDHDEVAVAVMLDDCKEECGALQTPAERGAANKLNTCVIARRSEGRDELERGMVAVVKFGRRLDMTDGEHQGKRKEKKAASLR